MTLLDLTGGLEPLQRWFEETVGHARLVAINSST